MGTRSCGSPPTPLGGHLCARAADSAVTAPTSGAGADGNRRSPSIRAYQPNKLACAHAAGRRDVHGVPGGVRVEQRENPDDRVVDVDRRHDALSTTLVAPKRSCGPGMR